MLSIKVKASAVTHLTDARYFAAWGVRWLGFNLSPGDDNHLSPLQIKAIREWVDGPLITGEFGAAQNTDDILAGIQLLDLDAVQVDALTSFETVLGLENQVPVLKEVIISQDTDLMLISEELEEFVPQVEAFVLNFAKGGLSWADIGGYAPFDAEELCRWAERFPIMPHIDFGEKSVSDILESFPFYGISVQGGAEEKVGYKNFDELDEIFEALEIVQ